MRCLVIAILVAGCSAAPPSGPLQVTPTLYDARALAQRALADGDTIDLVRPPQGGYVTFIGVQARNVADPRVLLTGRLFDSSGAPISEDTPPPQVLRESGGVFEPDLGSYFNVANIAVCPNASPVDRTGAPAQLEIEVKELSSGRVGSTRIEVTPTCRGTD